jgi:hypothetical protein
MGAGGMMARITNPAVIELGPDMWLALLIGPTTEDEFTDEDLRVAWEFHGEELTQRAQGKRPWGWWLFEAGRPEHLSRNEALRRSARGDDAMSEQTGIPVEGRRRTGLASMLPRRHRSAPSFAGRASTP